MAANDDKGATLESVAIAAGVSRQTVSNVLNAPDRVAEPTRVRVEAAIQALNYQPNRVARSLRTRATKLLGYRVQPAPPGVLNPVLDRFLHAVTEAADEYGFHVLLFTAPDGEAGLDHYAELLGQRAVDGFILSDTVVGDPRHGWLAARGVPFVSFGRTWQGPEQGPWVDVDGAAGTAEAVEHVYHLGHRRVAYLGWPEGSGVGADRLAGYQTACQRLGIEPRVVRSEQGMDLGRASAAHLLDGARPPTALICVSDVFAYGALRALAERDLRPGHDVAVVGFDDTPAAGLPGVELTSVAQPIEEAGRTVVRLLLADLGALETPGPPAGGPGGRDLPPGAGHRLLRPSLTIRASTAPAGTPAVAAVPPGAPSPTGKESP